MNTSRARKLLACAAAGSALFLACVGGAPEGLRQHRWWAGLGPVLPHDSFPADCTLCHLEGNWQEIREDFTFDHEAETGVRLEGAHARASCLRCHNDRGPVSVFAARGCAGCHEDVHLGRLGTSCTTCHGQHTWNPVGQYELHRRTRFPLTGAHAAISCWRCHPGAEIGIFQPTPVRCESCHSDELARATNPNHLGFGWTFGCDRCHQPTTWSQAKYP